MLEETGVERGIHTVKIAGVNIGGIGPESAPVDLMVV